MTLGRTMLKKAKLWTAKDKARFTNRIQINDDGSYRTFHPTKGWRYFGIRRYMGADGVPHKVRFENFWLWLKSRAIPAKVIQRIPERQKPVKDAAYYKSGVYPKHLRSS